MVVAKENLTSSHTLAIPFAPNDGRKIFSDIEIDNVFSMLWIDWNSLAQDMEKKRKIKNCAIFRSDFH